jgi:hypothetical protein
VKNGHWVFPQPEPKLWLPICGFVLIQGVLVFALIRLRQPKPDRASILGILEKSGTVK